MNNSTMIKFGRGCYVDLKYRKHVNELIKDMRKDIKRVNIFPLSDAHNNSGLKGAAQVYLVPWSKGDKKKHVAYITIPNVLDLNGLYTVAHEAGHVINKHLARDYDHAKDFEDIIADEYAISKFVKWSFEIPEEAKERIRDRQQKARGTIDLLL